MARARASEARSTAGVVPARAAGGIENQPVAAVVWVPRENLRANAYNPNAVAPVEMRLLKTSILEDGWTQPVVVRAEPPFRAGEAQDDRGGEIVDGFHRYTTAADVAVAALTGGRLPVVYLRPSDPAHQRMSTIRHNRARGTHGVLRMADITADLVETYGVSEADVMARLGMDEEEVSRLRDRGNMLKRGSAPMFNRGWTPSVDAGARTARVESTERTERAAKAGVKATAKTAAGKRSKG